MWENTNQKKLRIWTLFTQCLYYNLQFGLPTLPSLLVLLILNQKQSSGGVLQKKCSYEFCKIHKKTPALDSRFKRSCRSTVFNFFKKRDSRTCLLVNSAKFLIRPFFCINTFSFFKNNVTHIFWLSIFSA